ncbi:MAG: hypothetical protein MAG715_00761 [Methanonatronarchaeales archaeon]|nr:hypothetical protein [Methanonatronarchaeales archaeon]
MKRKRKGVEKAKGLEEKFLEENLEDLKAIASGEMESAYSREEVSSYLENLEEEPE